MDYGLEHLIFQNAFKMEDKLEVEVNVGQPMYKNDTKGEKTEPLVLFGLNERADSWQVQLFCLPCLLIDRDMAIMNGVA